MDYISVKDFADQHGLSERTVRNYCKQGKLIGAVLIGKTWSIPAHCSVPKRVNASEGKVSPLLKVLKEEKEARLKGGIYHRTQIDLTYNSNHIEGSRLSKEQTRYIFETNTVGITNEAVRVDDIIETSNHFRAIDYIIDHATDRIDEAYMKQLHRILKSGTSDAARDWFVVGDYKRLPNEVGGMETSAPEQVAHDIRKLLKSYHAKTVKTLEDIIDFHHQFESIHPFQDGNGRVGRLILFKECLANGIVPFIITEELKMFYYRGLQNWPAVKGFLMDTCLTAQDHYKTILDYFRIKY